MFYFIGSRQLLQKRPAISKVNTLHRIILNLYRIQKMPHKLKWTFSDVFAPPNPFFIQKWSDNTSKISELTYLDICSSLTDNPSEFTKEKIKC